VSAISGIPQSYSATGRPPGSYNDHHRWLYVGVAVLLTLVGVAVVLSVLLPGGGGRLGPAFPFGWFWGLVSLLFLFWAISWFFRWSWWGPWGWRRYHRWDGWAPRDSAVDIARERYARGEISREQFDQIRRDLEQRPPTP
jgi:putative membrane protein